MRDAAKTYQQESVSTQQKGKLIVMLYDGAAGFLQTAKQKLEEQDYAMKGVYLGKTQDIIAELNNCLDMEAAPEVANDLRALYNFLYRHLSKANIERSPEIIDECISILQNLSEAWQQVAIQTAPETAPDSAENSGLENKKIEA